MTNFSLSFESYNGQIGEMERVHSISSAVMRGA